MIRLPDRIAVTTDFSEHSKCAFPAAALLASRFQAQLLLVHVARADPPAILPWREIVSYSVPRDFLEKVNDKLHLLATTNTVFQGCPPRPVVLEGKTAVAIKSFAEQERISLLVMATHGHSGIQRLILGSVAGRVLRSVPCPVLTVRVEHAETIETRKPFSVQRILVPFDSSPHSVLALGVARAWSEAFSASVHILTVVPDAIVLYSNYPSGPAKFRDLVEEIEHDMLRKIELIIQREWRGADVSVAVRHGQVAPEILRESKSKRVDLVVMGSQGLTPASHWPLGGVAEKVVRTAPCPVLVVREAEKNGAPC